jgi:hypothetical protein
MRVMLLLLAIAGTFAGCGSAEKQWYKAGADYTVAEFQRDRAKCEKNGKLDEECLKQLGWVPLTPDKERALPQNPNANQRGRYY